LGKRVSSSGVLLVPGLLIPLFNRWQLVDALAGMSWAFVVSFLILLVLEPIMYYARGRRPRSPKATGMPIKDLDIIQEVIEMQELHSKPNTRNDSEAQTVVADGEQNQP